MCILSVSILLLQILNIFENAYINIRAFYFRKTMVYDDDFTWGYRLIKCSGTYQICYFSAERKLYFFAPGYVYIFDFTLTLESNENELEMVFDILQI